MRIVSAVERCTSLGLALLLLLSSILAIVMARITTADLLALNTANTLNDLYQEARYAVAAEESLERKYRLEPRADVRAAHRDAETSLEAVIRKAAAESGPANRAQDASILRAHDAYITATRSMFAAVDAHLPDLALRLDHDKIDPVFSVVQAKVFRLAVEQRSITKTIAARAETVQSAVIDIAVMLSIASIVCFAAYIVALGLYKRRLLRAHRSEVQQLAEAALVDNLTGIGNHRAYKEDLQREVSWASRHGETLSLALLDIDEMKMVNDQNGHMHGDRVLQGLGELLRGLRAEDRSFRLGGDEFAVLLSNTSEHVAQTVIARLRESAERSLFGVTISAGIATATGEDCDAETLQGQADAALYAAKRAGRNTCVTFDEAIDDMWPLSPSKVRQLRSVIAGESVSIVFQPIWDVAQCNILAYEALARPSAEFGFRGPQDMFDLAERVGRAHEIDAVCCRVTLRRAKELPDGVLLFINMTPQSFDHGHFSPRQFAADVVAAGLAPQRVVIEITERSIVNINVVIGVAKELQDLGFRIALDDTGAGNAGLEMLSHLPVEFVKIDREIIVKALTDRGARGVMAGIIAIAEETDAYVIGEGIEDIEMLDLVCGQDRDSVQKRGVRGLQGYLLRKPCATLATLADSDDVKAILQEIVLRNGRKPSLGEPAGPSGAAPSR